MLAGMEQLIAEIEAYATRRSVKPATVLQYAAGLGGQAWARWRSGAVCTMATAERIRKYMADNPPSESAEVSCPETIVADDGNNVKGSNNET